MKRTDSTNTLEETLDISSDKDKDKDKIENKNEIISSATSLISYQINNPLKKSFSEDTVTNIIEQEIPLTPPVKIKSRSRFSSAFRSLRGTRKKNTPTTATDQTEGGLITSGEEIDIESKSDDKDKKIKKKIKLSKKFSLNIRKYRGIPKKSNSSSENQQEQQQKQEQQLTTEQHQCILSNVVGCASGKINNNNNSNINDDYDISQVSLIDLPSENETEDDNDDNDDEEDDYNYDNDKNNKNNQEKRFKRKEYKNLQQKQNITNRDSVNNNTITCPSSNISTINKTTKFNDPESSLKFDKVRKIQITIQGKKIERINNTNQRDKLQTATTTSISGEEDYLTATEVDQTTNITSSLSPSISNSQNLIKSEQQSYSITTSPSSGNLKRQSRRKTKSTLKSSSSSKDQTQLADQSTQNTEKIIITQSTRDTPPLERAPPKPSSLEDNSPDKGAIKKVSGSHQQSQKTKTTIDNNLSSDLLMRQRDKSSSLERGRRYPKGPRPSEDEILAAEKNKILKNQKIITGNNILNPNLSGSIGVIEAKELIFDLTNIPPLPPTPPTPPIQRTRSTAAASSSIQIVSSGGKNINNNKPIEFSLGKSVRSQPLRQLNISDSQQPDSILLPSGNQSSTRNSSSKEGIKKSNKDIEYYTDEEEERELIDSVNRDSYLSGISEYSLDSELNSIEQQQQEQSELVVMPAFGDLTMDNEVSPIMTSNGDKREHLYKILIIGELGTGKTSFIKRYVHKFFSQNYRATIGVDFALKVLHWDQNTIIRLQLWDIAGQERFGNMTRVYYKDAVGAFIVFDVTRSGTFECVTKWKEDLDSKVQLADGSPIPCILLANKCDQEKQGVVTNTDKMDEYVKENGFAGWFETSAKENVNIDEAARALVNKILLNDKLISAVDLDAEKIELAGSSGYGGSGGKKKDCAC